MGSLRVRDSIGPFSNRIAIQRSVYVAVNGINSPATTDIGFCVRDSVRQYQPSNIHASKRFMSSEPINAVCLYNDDTLLTASDDCTVRTIPTFAMCRLLLEKYKSNRFVRGISRVANRQGRLNVADATRTTHPPMYGMLAAHYGGR